MSTPPGAQSGLLGVALCEAVTQLAEALLIRPMQRLARQAVERQRLRELAEAEQRRALDPMAYIQREADRQRRIGQRAVTRSFDRLYSELGLTRERA